ncbi:helix-turn-helix domain-containing protein [Actinosynnema sp. CA-248983]
MVEDWSAVAGAINARATELALKQKELAERSGVSLAIVREIQQGRIQRRRNPRTLEALSIALDWHPQHLAAVLRGENPPEVDAANVVADDPLVPLLHTVIRELRGLRAQVGALTSRLSEPGPTAHGNSREGDE